MSVPAATRVYLTDIGTPEIDAEMLAAARRLKDAGCIPVPHLAARRIASREALETRIGQLAEQAGVNDILVVGGGTAKPAGPYASTMDILETGLLDRFGIKDIAVAGHPAGNPDFTEASANEILRQKKAFADHTGARLRIVTQFGFDPARVIAWVDGLTKIGITVPVHIGMAGPTGLTTLMKYAKLCGVSNSLSVLSKSADNIASLMAGYSPETFATAIEEELATLARPTVSHLHVFPFSGFEKASHWLRSRGSW